MQKKFLLSAIVLLFASLSFAQQLPLNTCGIVNTYDASGNRLRRLYFCNNGIDPYPTRVPPPIFNSEETATHDSTASKPNAAKTLHPKITQEFQVVDALYPNPTTGKFSVTFSKALHDATISVIDVNEKVIVQFKASGYKVDFNLSSVAAGVYFVTINDSGSIITKKVVKQ